MKKFEHQVTAKSGCVHLTMSYPNCDDKRMSLLLKLYDSQIQCQVDAEFSFTVSIDHKLGQWMVLFHADHERFVSEHVQLAEFGTRDAFSLALHETPLSSNAVLLERVLDNICAFAKSVNKWVEPERKFW